MTRQVSPGPRRQAISSMFPYGFQIAAFHAPPESRAIPSSAQWRSPLAASNFRIALTSERTFATSVPNTCFGSGGTQ